MRRQRMTAAGVALVLTAALIVGVVALLRDLGRDQLVLGDAATENGSISFTVREADGWHLATVNPDGTDRQVLTAGIRDYSTSWSPDGTQIAFDRDHEDGGGIWIMAAEGTDQRQLTEGEDFFPRWSPDGSQIVFSRYGDGMYSADEVTKYPTSYLWIVNVDGTGQQQLTQGKLSDVAGSWSPDGTRIAFLRSSGDGSGIWVIRADGTTAHEVVHLPFRLDGLPVWSPDGEQILYPNDGGIWVVKADGTGAHRLLESGTDPSWSPDGSRIAYADDGDIWVAAADGTEARHVTTDPNEEIQPSWGRAVDEADSSTPPPDLIGPELANALGLVAHPWSVGGTLQVTSEGVLVDGEPTADCAASYPGEVVIVQQVGDATFYCAHGATEAEAWGLGQRLIGHRPTPKELEQIASSRERPRIGGWPEDVDGDGLISDSGPERIPELIRASGDAGVGGYVRYEDLHGLTPSSPEEAASISGLPWVVPVYADDGISIIDRYTLA
jgi:hypothetical protein